MSLKLIVWIYTAAVALASLAIAALSGCFELIFLEFHVGSLGDSSGPVTWFFVHQQWWVLFIFVPFLITAGLITIGRTVTSEKIFLFASCSTLTIVGLFTLAVLALVPPFLPNSLRFRG